MGLPHTPHTPPAPPTPPASGHCSGPRGSPTESLEEAQLVSQPGSHEARNRWMAKPPPLGSQKDGSQREGRGGGQLSGFAGLQVTAPAPSVRGDRTGPERCAATPSGYGQAGQETGERWAEASPSVSRGCRSTAAADQPRSGNPVETRARKPCVCVCVFFLLESFCLPHTRRNQQNCCRLRRHLPLP